MSITVTPLSAALGAEVAGVDIAAGIPRDDIEGILSAWHRHGLVVLRDQRITEDEQVAFGSHFGEVAPWSRFAERVAPPPGRNAYIMWVTNLKENGAYIGNLAEGEIEFHSDGIYVEEPLAATMLYAVEVTRTGGETAFANMYTAYETLPDHVKARIDGRQALHAFTYDSTRAEENAARKANWDGVAHCTHPIVRVHPVTGRKALYVNRLMTQEIVGMASEESRALLESLYGHMENPAFVYEHRWRRGDVLIWDNRCLAHARRTFPDHETRLMKRLTIKGERPVG